MEEDKFLVVKNKELPLLVLY